MKIYALPFLLIILISCNTQNEVPLRKYIEPSDYNIMSYRVKDTMYHKSVKNYLNNDSHISIIGDSIFNITKKLGEFVFKGNTFKYKIINDSLILSNNKQKQFYKILDIRPNSFSIEVQNKYFEQLDLVKPLGKRRRIESVVEIEF